jgi:hypothetical protein
MPDRNAHSHPLGGEAPHKPPAEEPRAAEYADRGHGIAFSMAEKTDNCVGRAVERGELTLVVVESKRKRHYNNHVKYPF